MWDDIQPSPDWINSNIPEVGRLLLPIYASTVWGIWHIKYKLWNIVALAFFGINFYRNLWIFAPILSTWFFLLLTWHELLTPDWIITSEVGKRSILFPHIISTPILFFSRRLAMLAACVYWYCKAKVIPGVHNGKCQLYALSFTDRWEVCIP